MKFDQTVFDALLDSAIEEDIGRGDMSTETCVSPTTIVSGKLLLKQKGVIAGLGFVQRLFHKLDPHVTITPLIEEGLLLNAGTVIAQIEGPARSILSGERIALNLLRHTSGVATVTASYVKKVKGLKCVILDTRKTLPGLRYLEKYAVQVGGGTVHRWGLDDKYIIKNNHLTFLAAEIKNPITEAVRRVREKAPDAPIEIEIVNALQLDEVLKADVQAIMLNNLRPDEVERCVKKIRKTNKDILIYFQSTAVISLETVRIYAETGVDGIAVSALTHSVQPLEIGMRLLI